MGIVTKPLTIYRWEDGHYIDLEPSSAWDEELQKNVIVFYYILKSVSSPEKELVRMNKHLIGDTDRLYVTGTEPIKEYESILRGFVVDMGIKPIAGNFLRNYHGSFLLDSGPIFIDDDRWDHRYEEAKKFIVPKSHWKPQFLDLIEGFEIYPVLFDSITNEPRYWSATVERALVACQVPFEETVDLAILRHISPIRPMREKEEWESINKIHGTWVHPDTEEIELYHVLGENLPFQWDREDLYRWYLEQLPPEDRIPKKLWFE